jgi:UDP-2,3-diacylglucosamine hydrolase
MSIHVREEHLLVISDIHLGNPFFSNKHHIVDFLDYAYRAGASLCINGDGLDIMQTSFTRLARDVPEVFNGFKRIVGSGGSVYYTIGNHDIVLEHFFEDWGLFHLVPFLNVRSGSKRIRIEHGHLYDPFFVRWPNLYAFLTMAAGLMLDVAPSLYRAWIAWENIYYGRVNPHRGDKSIVEGESEAFLQAVIELHSRAFDVVVFGHTHHPGYVDLGNQRYYVNTGSWLTAPIFAEIRGGEVTLRQWPNGTIEPRHVVLEPDLQLATA